MTRSVTWLPRVYDPQATLNPIPPATPRPYPPSHRWNSRPYTEEGGVPPQYRPEGHAEAIDQIQLLQHAAQITNKPYTMTAASIGKRWVTFEMVARDYSIMIARVRLNTTEQWGDSKLSRADDEKLIRCELAVMTIVRERFPLINVPQVYAFEGSESQRSMMVGGMYMLTEGFYGQTLQDKAPDWSQLPFDDLNHILYQWCEIQGSLATLRFPDCGPIHGVDEDNEPVTGKFAEFAEQPYNTQGPYSSTRKYFVHSGAALYAHTRIPRPHTSQERDKLITFKRGVVAFMDIVARSRLFSTENRVFPLQHMGLSPENIIVDSEYNFVGILGWGSAHSAPWEAVLFPQPCRYMMTYKKANEIMADPTHPECRTLRHKCSLQELYITRLRGTELDVLDNWKDPVSFSRVLGLKKSKIYDLYTQLKRNGDENDEITREMARLAFDMDEQRIDEYITELNVKMRSKYPFWEIYQ